MRRLMIVLAVLVACMAPNAAYAQDVDYLDSFTSGVGTWGGGQKEEMDSNSSVQEFENGGLLAAPAEGQEGELSTVQQVNSTLNSFNAVPWGGGTTTIQGFLRTFLGAGGSAEASAMRAMVIIAPVGIVFMWWGVRKALRVIMASFRRGRANV